MTIYFKNLEVENFGPLDRLNIDFGFHENGDPKPLILVGLNGSGKSIVLAHLINSLTAIQQEEFEDSDISKGRVYKLRSPIYIKDTRDYAFSNIEFTDGISVTDWQLKTTKKIFEEKLGYTPIRRSWEKIPEFESSWFDTNFLQKKSELKNLFLDAACVYFPVNRHEEPAWLNYDDLKNKASFSDLKRMAGYSNRQIIQTNPLKKNQDWILDVVLDRAIYEAITDIVPLNDQLAARTPTFSGANNAILEAINRVLGTILGNDSNSLRLGVGTRKSRQISVMRNEQSWVPNIFQLSTGEVLLLNLFLSILRDFDLSTDQITSISDVKGIVVVDEVDAHLHVTYQIDVLPKLIKLFPKVQFVLTSHSPLFLIGLEKVLGRDAFDIVSLPSGEVIQVEHFSEFSEIYESFKDSKKFQTEVLNLLETDTKPIVYLEGTTDIAYLQKAATFLNKLELLDAIDLRDGGGAGNLTKIFNAFDNPLAKDLVKNVVLLYDCDVSVQSKSNGKVHKLVIPKVDENPIAKGIENLFSNATITKVEQLDPRWIDITSVTKRVRSQDVVEEPVKSVNIDEKRNLCNWICTNGVLEDFQGFQTVFDLIESKLDA